MAKIWSAKEAAISISTAISGGIVTTSSFASQMLTGGATVVTAVFKNVTIEIPEGEVEQQDLLGSTSDFQNSELHFKPFGMAKLTGTTILQGDEVLEPFAYGVTTTSAGYTTYRVGNGNRPQLTVALVITDGTDEVAFALDDSYITKLGDVKIDGPDGQFEQDVSIVCKTSTFYGPQFKD